MTWRRMLLGVLIVAASVLPSHAAITTRYFSTAANGAGDGTTWTDRAALFDGSGNWSTVITGFNFTSDSLVAYIEGPGKTYTCAQLLQTSVFTLYGSVQGPQAYSPLIIHTCDSSGNALSVPSPDWTCARPVWSLTNIPVISASSNGISSLASVCFRLCKFTASARNSYMLSSGSFDWCVFSDSTSNSGAVGLSGPVRVTNCVVQMTGTSFDCGISASSLGTISNVRLEGNASASSGNRRGLSHATTALQVDRLVATGFVGGPVYSTSTNTGHWIGLRKFVLANNGGTGYTGHSTASQTNVSFLDGGIITDNGGYGINAGAEGIAACRVHLRDNGSSGDTTAMGNWPTTLLDTDTSYGGDQAARQAALFVDYANGDFRVKKSSAYWGKGYGVEDEGSPTLPAVSDVWYGVTGWGYASDIKTGTKRASSIANCSEGNVKNGVTIDDVKGTYTGSGGVDLPDFCVLYGGG